MLNNKQERLTIWPNRGNARKNNLCNKTQNTIPYYSKGIHHLCVYMMIKCKDKVDVTWKQDIWKTQITLEITTRHQNVHKRNGTCKWKPLLDSGVLLAFIYMYARSKVRTCECILCHGNGSLNNKFRRRHVSETAHFMNIVSRKRAAEFNLPLIISALHNPCASAIYFIRGTSVFFNFRLPIKCWCHWYRMKVMWQHFMRTLVGRTQQLLCLEQYRTTLV